jgi:2-amino-4-hydroxy-6-hydroxymethyldihydropteridine diphosphokinase
VYGIAYVALGANLGRREENVLRAVRLIEARRAARIVRVSSLYESEPEGIPGAPPFINAVAEVVPLLRSSDLLQRLQAVETIMGRTGRHGESREIDLDLIAFGDDVSASEALVLPHPRFHARAFVLVPLREVAPGFRCPRTGRSIDELMDSLSDAGRVRRVAGRALVMRG